MTTEELKRYYRDKRDMYTNNVVIDFDDLMALIDRARLTESAPGVEGRKSLLREATKAAPGPRKDADLVVTLNGVPVADQKAGIREFKRRALRAATPPTDALVEACQAAIRYDDAIRSCANDPKKMASFCSAQGDDLDALYLDWITKARKALPKDGQTPQSGKKEDGGRSKCAALQGFDPPQDCSWPHCNCDPHAEKVLAALQEEGWRPPPENKNGD